MKKPVNNFMCFKTMHIRLLSLSLMMSAAFPSEAIVMRHDVDEAEFLSSFEEWPSTAYFQLAGRFGNGTGTLLAPRWVLTAGHVTHYLKVGDTVTINGGDYVICRVISHPDYVLHSPDNDIGLVELETPVHSVKPALLYEGNDEAGQIVTFVGAGRPGDGLSGQQGKPGVIRAASNRVEETRPLLLVFTFDEPPDALALEGISGPGDSGGPAYLRKDGQTYLLGVSSFQGESESGIEGVYGVKEFYSRVSAHVEWISSVIGHQKESP